MNMISRHWQVAKAALAEEKQAGKKRAFDEIAFLPAALEIVEQPVSPTGRRTAWVLLALFAFMLAWMTFGKVDVVASATGKLIPADNVKVIQPSQTGIVRAIMVRDGQHVRKGDVLVELDATISTAEAEQARKALETAELDMARDRAILSALDGQGLRFMAPGTTPPAIASTQLDLARAQLAEIEARADQHASDRDAASAARSEAIIQAAKLTETLPLLDEQISANEQLLDKGFVSKLKVVEMRRQRLAAARDRDAALASAAKARAQMNGAGSAYALARASARATVLAELAKAEADAKLRREELAKASQMSSRQRILSPVDGVVAQLVTHTVGGTVESARPIMVVVPDGEELVAEVKILNRDVGFVRAGQIASIKLDAFPFTRFGTLQGRVATIASDAVEDEKLGLVYPARLIIDRSASDDAVTPSVGMQATADIGIGRRSILSYLLDPIEEVAREAGREK